MSGAALKNSFNKPTQQEVDDFVEAAGGGKKAAVTKFLNKYSVPVDEKSAFNRTALMMACRYGHQDIAELLLQKGADINLADDSGYTPLILAAASGHKNITELLLKNGAPLNQKDNDSKTPLMWAVSNGHSDIVALLLDRGADIHEKDGAGTTLLMLAARYGEPVVINLLLEKGADINEQNNFGDTALMHAAEEREEDTIKLLVAKGAVIDEKSSKVIEVVRGDKKMGIVVTTASVLVDAAEKGDNAAITKILDEHGAAIINQKNIHGWIAVNWAIRGGHEDIVKLLLDCGGDVNLKDGYGMTPLMEAAAQKNVNITKMLLEKGASTEGQNKADGLTALMWAAHNGSREVVELLLEHGADLEVEDLAGDTALEHAGHDEEIAGLIVQWPEILKKRAEEKKAQELAEDIADFSPGLKRMIPAPRPFSKRNP